MGMIFSMAPRRLILLALFVLGLCLRLWGLAWGRGEAASPHPDEWAWRILESLSPSQPAYAGLFNQFFYSLAALGKGLAEIVAGSAKLLLGEARFVAEGVVPSLMAGRFLVALFGAAQAPLAYSLARGAFGSVGAGLLAAAMIAVSPLLVTQSHFFSLATPLATMIMLCLLAAHDLARRPEARSCAVAGLACGLTVTTEPMGVWALAYPALALALGLWRRVAAPRRLLAYWPAVFALGLAAGVIVGSPWLVWPDDAQGRGPWALWAISQPPEGWWAHLARRGGQLWELLAEMGGLEITGLWLAAAALSLGRDRPLALLIVTAPLPFLAAGLAAQNMSIESVAVCWTPLATASAGWPLALICRRLPRYNLQVAAALALGLLLCLTPLWRSLGLAYIFWQTDTVAAAKTWLADNLPADAPLLAGPGCPPTIFQQAEPAAKGLAAERLIENGAYLLWNRQAADAQAPPPGLQRVASFALSDRWSPMAAAPGAANPRWINPVMEIYGPARAAAVTRPLALFRPSADVQRDYDMIYVGNATYGQNSQTMLLRGHTWRERVLRGPGPLDSIAVHLRNMGADLALVEVRQGPGLGRVFGVFPGQDEELIVEAKAWPPMSGGVYPVKARLLRGDAVLARIDWDPLIIGRRALEREDLDDARRFLAKALAQQPGSFDAGALLAGALTELGLLDQARKVMDALDGEDGGPAKDFIELASRKPDAAWLEKLRRLTGYDPALLLESLGHAYQIDGPPCLPKEREAPFSGPGFSGVLRRTPGGGELKIWLDQPMPAGHGEVWLDFAEDRSAPEGWAGRAQVWGHGPEGSRLLTQQGVDARTVARGKSMRLSFVCPKIGQSLEIRLEGHGGEPTLQRLRVGVDLAGHIAGVLRWYHDAQGRLALGEGRYAQAVEAFEAALASDPGFDRVQLPLARALSDAGQAERAAHIARLAEKTFTAQPDILAQLRELYLALRLADDAARVEKSLAYLRPSLKFESRFEGGLTLLGYDLPKAEVSPGGQLDVNYYWRAWSRPPTNFFIFVHLEGEGRIINFDHLLDHGRVDMTSLTPGQVVREDYQLSIPTDAKPGQYRLVVGLWDPRFTGKGARVIEGQGNGAKEVVLATITIK